MTKKLKGILIGIGVVSIIIGLVYLKICSIKVPIQGDYIIEEEIYRQPIIKIPFLAPQLPVAKESLPMPTKEIKKTIEIEVPPSEKPTKQLLREI